jgi:tRNA threonylcarbamoyladenosine biosynthesis protein TsaB
VKLLGIETSSTVGSVALRSGERTFARSIATPREQTELLLKLVDETLAEAGVELGALDGIAFGRGPGSFTGLRIAAAISQGLSLASGVPLLPVSSLLCLAQTAARVEHVERALVCVDARMGEVYWAEFAVTAGHARAVGDERLGLPGVVTAPAGTGWTAVGDAFASCREALAAPLARAGRVLPDLRAAAEDLFPHAAADLESGRAVGAAEALPVYLREHTAWRRSP